MQGNDFNYVMLVSDSHYFMLVSDINNFNFLSDVQCSTSKEIAKCSAVYFHLLGSSKCVLKIAMILLFPASLSNAMVHGSYTPFRMIVGCKQKNSK